MGTTVAPLPSAAVTLRVSKSVVRHLPTVARVLLGALFLFSGVLGLVMAPQPTPGLPAGAVAFAAALAKTGYMMPLVSATEAVVGLLLLANRFVPLALALLAPVVVNIFAFHLFLEPGGRPVAVVVCALELYLAWGYRGAYRPMLAMRARRGNVPTS
jgi:uncharacterized membrane protein YphA (DoxX/SURF4 family)